MRYDKIFADAGYHSALMTTFRFDPAVFDGIIRPRLRSNGCRNIAVLADRDMLNASFADVGPPVFAGTRYHIAKRSVHGAFHPKLVLQLGKNTGRLLVGSANLTSAGLQGNLEILECIEVTAEDRRAEQLLVAAFAYFEEHADPADEALEQALTQARNQTPWLRRTSAGSRVETEAGFVEFVTEAESGTIADRFIDAVGQRRVSRLLCAAPYWDKSLEAVSSLQAALSPEITALVVAPEAQDFGAEMFRTLTRTSLHSSEYLPGIGARRFHAKVLVAETDGGDFVLTGSSNMSVPGLFRERRAGNAEACILRREQRGTALARLGFDACLHHDMPLDALRKRTREGGAASDGEAMPPDGGAVFLSGAEIEWHPPQGVDISDCSLHIFNRDGVQLSLARPEKSGGRIWLLGDFDVEVAASAIAEIGGVMSAPMFIAHLANLRRYARAPLRGRGKGLEADLEIRGALDAELCSLIRQFFDDVSEPVGRMPDRQNGTDGDSHGKKDEDAEDDEHLEATVFSTLAPESASATASDAAMASIYDVIAMMLSRMNPPEPKNFGGCGGSGNHNTGTRQRQSEWRRKKFGELLATIQNAYRERGLDPLSITSLTLVRTFIGAMSEDGEPLCPSLFGQDNEKEGKSQNTNRTHKEEKAFGPLEPSGGWIRIIGRCVKAFVDALPEDISEADLKDEQIAAFADIQAAAELVFRAAEREKIKVLVLAMGAVIAKLAIRLGPALEGHRGKEELMHRQLALSKKRVAKLWGSDSVEV